MAHRHDRVVIAVREQDRALVSGDGRRRADVVDDVAARSKVDTGRQPGERVGDEVGDRQAGQLERQSSEAVRARGTGRRDDGSDPRVRGGRQDRADAAHRMADDRPDADLGLLDQRVEGGQRILPELAGGQWQLLGRVLAVAADVEGQAVEPGRVEEHGEGQRAIARRFPAVDEDDARAALTASGRDEPRRQGDAVGFDEHRFVRQAEIGRRDPGRVPARIPGTHAIGQREAVREAERGGGSGSRDPGAAEIPHVGRGRQPAPTVKSGRRQKRAGPGSRCGSPRPLIRLLMRSTPSASRTGPPRGQDRARACPA